MLAINEGAPPKRGRGCIRLKCGRAHPPVAGADLRAALVASCLRGALPPVLLRAVCLVRAISVDGEEEVELVVTLSV